MASAGVRPAVSPNTYPHPPQVFVGRWFARPGTAHKLPEFAHLHDLAGRGFHPQAGQVRVRLARSLGGSLQHDRERVQLPRQVGPTAARKCVNASLAGAIPCSPTRRVFGNIFGTHPGERCHSFSVDTEHNIGSLLLERVVPTSTTLSPAEQLADMPGVGPQLVVATAGLG